MKMYKNNYNESFEFDPRNEMCIPVICELGEMTGRRGVFHRTCSQTTPQD